MFPNKKHVYLPYFQGQVREMCKVQQSIKEDKTVQSVYNGRLQREN